MPRSCPLTSRFQKTLKDAIAEEVSEPDLPSIEEEEEEEEAIIDELALQMSMKGVDSSTRGDPRSESTKDEKSKAKKSKKESMEDMKKESKSKAKKAEKEYTKKSSKGSKEVIVGVVEGATDRADPYDEDLHAIFDEEEALIDLFLCMSMKGADSSMDYSDTMIGFAENPETKKKGKSPKATEKSMKDTKKKGKSPKSSKFRG